MSVLHLAGGAFGHFVLHLHGVSFHCDAGQLPSGAVFCLSLLNIKSEMSLSQVAGTFIPTVPNLVDSCDIFIDQTELLSPAED